jgi:hypothetical protein
MKDTHRDREKGGNEVLIGPVILMTKFAHNLNHDMFLKGRKGNKNLTLEV